MSAGMCREGWPMEWNIRPRKVVAGILVGGLLLALIIMQARLDLGWGSGRTWPLTDVIYGCCAYGCQLLTGGAWNLLDDRCEL